jgi:hypothetical protein
VSFVFKHDLPPAVEDEDDEDVVEPDEVSATDSE